MPERKLIYADTVVEELSELILLDDHEKKVLESFVETCLAVDAETKWIPVFERLPDKATDYLCRCIVNYDNTYPFYMVLRYILFHENPHFQHETKGGMKVTHWMPLPEPPQEETQ